jgi:hypothetical protein
MPTVARLRMPHCHGRQNFSTPAITTGVGQTPIIRVTSSGREERWEDALRQPPNDARSKSPTANRHFATATTTHTRTPPPFDQSQDERSYSHCFRHASVRIVPQSLSYPLFGARGLFVGGISIGTKKCTT